MKEPAQPQELIRECESERMRGGPGEREWEGGRARVRGKGEGREGGGRRRSRSAREVTHLGPAPSLAC